jgi:hypothetical protein
MDSRIVNNQAKHASRVSYTTSNAAFFAVSDNIKNKLLNINFISGSVYYATRNALASRGATVS